MLYLKFLCINEMLAVVVAISRRRRRRFGGIIDAGAGIAAVHDDIL